MIEIQNSELFFSFPEVHKSAKLRISFQRTLRIPDDGKTYPLPPGLGRFPIQHVDDFSDRVPDHWMTRGGVMMPMYQSEALWIYFGSEYVRDRDADYPFAVQVATGKINAVNGENWRNKLFKKDQNYVVVPEQPWLDGYCIGKGLIRQFVAMPLGNGYTAEEQITGRTEHGGLQIIVYPMRSEVFKRRFPKIPDRDNYLSKRDFLFSTDACAAPDMGFAPGGVMHQEIYEDPYKKSDWDKNAYSRCFIHVANSLVWRSITGQEPPTVPFTAEEYTSAGLPWFDYYDEQATTLEGSKTLKKIKSVVQIAEKKGENPLPENQSVSPVNIVN